MTNPDPLTYLQTLLAKDFGTHSNLQRKSRDDVEKPGEPLVITLSRDYGALGEEIAKCLSDCLGIPIFDQEILDMVAKRAKSEAFYFKQHDEGASAGLTTFLYSLIKGKSATLEDYRTNLYEVVADIARKDGIIIGRGAHLILSGKKVFRIRVVGSKLVCAQRIASKFDMPPLEAERKVYEINSKRHKSVIDLYSDAFEHCSLDYAKNFDLVINTDHIPADGAMGVILLAMRAAGFFAEVPQCKG